MVFRFLLFELSNFTNEVLESPDGGRFKLSRYFGILFVKNLQFLFT